MQKQPVAPLPSWVPEDACRYLDHTEAGRSIRQLARSAGCHPSTVLRQVRRIESRRDDPLVDGALHNLAACHYGSAAAMHREAYEHSAIGGAAFERDLAGILRGLCLNGTVLAVAQGMEKAVLIREDKDEIAHKTVVDRRLAEALALRDWISCSSPGRVNRYHITATGRTALSGIMAEAENRAQRGLDGFSESQVAFGGAGSNVTQDKKPRRVRYGQAESPLDALARLHDRDGNPFLSIDLVRAGERLREDFELAQIGDHVALSQNQFNAEGCGASIVASPASDAKIRVVRVFNHLGTGLSDIALRCCCHLEGLEAAERQLGWSARSGKIVLRIALQQLRLHYDRQSGSDELIG